MPYLEFKDVRQAWPMPNGTLREVLRDVSGTLELGASVALTGASGAGKSSLLNILAGLAQPLSGRVRIGECVVTATSAQRLTVWRGAELGFVWQTPRLLPDLRAEENVALPLLMRRQARGESLRQAVKLMKQLKLAHCIGQTVGVLSGGEQQRVALARAIVGRPRLILADEPTAHLDDATGAELVLLLLTYCQNQPAALVLATHQMALAKRCQKRWHLSEGTLTDAL